MTALFMLSGSVRGDKEGFGGGYEKHNNATVKNNNSLVGRVGEVLLAMKSGDCPSDISRLSQM